MKGAWVRPLADLRELPGESGGKQFSPWGHRCWQQPFSGAHAATRTLVLASNILKSSH